jgi:hypothetical protein
MLLLDPQGNVARPAVHGLGRQMRIASQSIPGAYKPLFFDNDFSYLTNPTYDRWFAGDRLKQLNLLDGWTLDVGGSIEPAFMRSRIFAAWA